MLSRMPKGEEPRVRCDADGGSLRDGWKARPQLSRRRLKTMETGDQL